MEPAVSGEVQPPHSSARQGFPVSADDEGAEIGDEVRVEWVTCPVDIHRVAVHHGDIALAEHLVDTEPVVGEETGRVKASGDRVVGIALFDQLSHLPDPGSARSSVVGMGKQIGLVPQVPHPDPRVLPVLADDRPEEETPRIEGSRVMEHVPIRRVHDHSPADHLTDVWGRVPVRRWIQEPSRRPVGPAHVTGEEGHIQTQPSLGSEVEDDAEVAKTLGRDRVG